MTPVFPPSTPRRVLSARRLILLATAASLGAAAVAIGIDGSHRSILPAITKADAAQRPVGFGDLAEKVKPAVIAVRVKRNADAKAGDVLVLGKPLGVGVLSAALKKEQLDAAGYERMIATTTRLNTPGPDLAALPGVHALTDVTGFGLAGHALELARGANLSVDIEWAKVPVLEGVRELARAGFITGASGRNWAGYGSDIALPTGFADVDQALLTDPQTSGGLLVSCTPDSVDQVLAVFRQHGFGQAAVIGEARAAVGPRLTIR